MEIAQASRAFDAHFGRLFEINPNTIIPERNRYTASIDQVDIGGIIRIASEIYFVTSTAMYTEKVGKGSLSSAYIAHELVLTSVRTGRVTYLEWSKDDEIEISLVERKLSLAELNRELRDDEGKFFNIDEDIDDCAEQRWGIRLNGLLYDYVDDWDSRFSTCDGRNGDVTMYEFGNAILGWLTIEAWKDGSGWEYEGYLSKTISSSAIEIISIGI